MRVRSKRSLRTQGWLTKSGRCKKQSLRRAEAETAIRLANLVKATSTRADCDVLHCSRPPAADPGIPHNDGSQPRRLAPRRAVQRALTEYGYGQLKPTGIIGADTQAAIVKFERDRKMPATDRCRTAWCANSPP